MIHAFCPKIVIQILLFYITGATIQNRIFVNMFVLVSLKFLTINLYNHLPTFINKKSPLKNSIEIFPNN